MRTDQLDGETDWKLRLPVACTQRLPTAAVRLRKKKKKKMSEVLGTRKYRLGYGTCRRNLEVARKNDYLSGDQGF